MKKIFYLTTLALCISISDLAAQDFKIRPTEGTDSTTLTILSFGLVHPGYQQAAVTVAKKYGFTYIAAAGCVVTEALLDSIRSHNEKVYAILDKKHGTGWKEKMDAEVQAALNAKQNQLVLRQKQKSVN